MFKEYLGALLITVPSLKTVTKIQAMEAWNKLNGKNRQKKTDFYYPGRKHTELTGFEIQKMYQLT